MWGLLSVSDGAPPFVVVNHNLFSIQLLSSRGAFATHGTVILLALSSQRIILSQLSRKRGWESPTRTFIRPSMT